MDRIIIGKIVFIFFIFTILNLVLIKVDVEDSEHKVGLAYVNFYFKCTLFA